MPLGFDLGDFPLTPGGAIPGFPTLTLGDLDDKAVKDERVPLQTFLARHGGWSGNDLKEAAAVAIAESGLRKDVVNQTPCGTNANAVGWFQICTVHAGTHGLSPDRAKAAEQLKNPATNTRVAYAIWRAAGGTFAKDWEVVTNGAYKKFLGQNPLVTVEKGSVTDAIGDTAGAVAGAVASPLDTLVVSLGRLSIPLRGSGSVRDTWVVC
jgi:hypothetical protein